MSEISRYVQSLLQPIVCGTAGIQGVLGAETETRSAADAEARLARLGSLFSQGKYKDITRLVSELHFSDIPRPERELLPIAVFTELYEMYRERGSLTSEFAEALLGLLITIEPEVVLAHQTKLKNQMKLSGMVTLDYASNVSSAVNGVVFFREFMSGPNSRKHEFGHRIQSALASQGWDVSLAPLELLFNYSSTNVKDFILIDIEVYSIIRRPEFMGDVLSHLRKYFRKIIMIEPDPWAGLHDADLCSVAGLVDHVWGFTADWQLLAEPSFQKKGILFPNVGGFDHLNHLKFVEGGWDTCTFNFTGSVQGYNVNRVYWILELLRRSKPVRFNITYPGIDDGLDHEVSLQRYAQTLALTQASLNFITRKDGSRIITGRSIEVISLSRLLVQEKCPAFSQYFCDGEHFLEFATIEELCALIDFLESRPAVAQKISSQGYLHYLERYSSRKLVEHFQTIL